ncbi:acyl-CoA carboxylase subunit epsilon [Corynebacterium poyangense]|uniref:Acyl-CoA carboxylase subunit epsilon n=1 Tax=Corynebacterium poyangense TaxID=2684405 RepID=A0A7H0SMG4_9CORY|nr:acyl-CoA carboxylase subunit epsilon [Corynebacterium poyangense]MBZ8176842.1 acyl-CoA carboxylase subunit epsilon [Corynebacterium poyangense]QNQ89739.1 acyl-CoA carboxylase subunit epsilon [Corynebacterium poyangense]
MNEAPLFRVIKGNPSAPEVAALTAVIQQKIRAAENQKRQRSDSDPNLWGRFADRLHPHTIYNPAAFSTVTFT